MTGTANNVLTAITSLRQLIVTILKEKKSTSEKALGDTPFEHTTTLKHLRYLEEVIQVTGTTAPTTKQIIEHIENRRLHPKRKKNGPLLWSAVNTLMGSAAGAWRLAHFYLPELTSKDLVRDPEFAVAMKLSSSEMKREHVSHSFPMSKDQLHAAVILLVRSRNTTAAVALVLCWATTSRVKCLLSLQTRDIHCHMMNGTQVISVGFFRAKTTSRRGPYHVHTALGPYRSLVLTFLQKQTSTLLFPDAEATRMHMICAMKSISTKLECRSIRRGALVTMAKEGVDESTLMHFSGHLSTMTLHRYLGWGLYRGEQGAKGAAAASHLF
jgi:hypothetical protein